MPLMKLNNSFTRARKQNSHLHAVTAYQIIDEDARTGDRRMKQKQNKYIIIHKNVIFSMESLRIDYTRAHKARMYWRCYGRYAIKGG